MSKTQTRQRNHSVAIFLFPSYMQEVQGELIDVDDQMLKVLDDLDMDSELILIIDLVYMYSV